jgi:16S rRNA (cytosine967-C5)-methyltransferase
MAARKSGRTRRPPGSSAVGAHPPSRQGGAPRKNDPVRAAVLRFLLELEAQNRPGGGQIEQIEASFASPEDRRFFHNLVAELLRHRLRIDAVLDGLLTGRKLENLPAPIRAVLRIGAAQLLILTGVAPHAAVDTSVNLATSYGHSGTGGLVNAVLRRLSREGRDRWQALDDEPVPLEDVDAAVALLSVRYSHPAWIVRRFAARWGLERTQRVLAWDNTIPDYWIRLRSGPDGQGGSGPPGSAPGWIPGTARLPAGARPGEMPELARGEFTVQDGSAILVGFLPPEVAGLVIDLCAAPGTKTSHLFERAADKTRLLACDLSPGRLRRTRSGLFSGARAPDPRASLFLVAADGRSIPVRPPWNGILIDAPCSNLGVLRRRLDLRWRAREEEIARLSAVQAKLLEAAASGVAPRGWLVYSVCTTEPEEGIRQRDRFFGDHPEWSPMDLPAVVPPGARGRPGEMILVPGEWEVDGTYAFVARRGPD